MGACLLRGPHPHAGGRITLPSVCLCVPGRAGLARQRGPGVVAGVCVCMCVCVRVCVCVLACVRACALLACLCRLRMRIPRLRGKGALPLWAPRTRADCLPQPQPRIMATSSSPQTQWPRRGDQDPLHPCIASRQSPSPQAWWRTVHPRHGQRPPPTNRGRTDAEQAHRAARERTAHAAQWRKVALRHPAPRAPAVARALRVCGRPCARGAAGARAGRGWGRVRARRREGLCVHVCVPVCVCVCVCMYVRVRVSACTSVCFRAWICCGW